MSAYNRKKHFQKKHAIVRKKIHGSADRPRLAYYRSNRNLIVQLIDDDKSHTLVGICQKGKNKEAAMAAAKIIAKKAKTKKIKKIVFDRGGYQFFNNIKTFADECRKQGLEF